MADVELTVGVQANSLVSQIRDQIKKASKEKVELKLGVDKTSLKESIQKVGGETGVKIKLSVNQTYFASEMKKVLSTPPKTKLKINVDEAYLKKQVDAALKNIGSTAGGASGGTSATSTALAMMGFPTSGSSGSSSSSSADRLIKRYLSEWNSLDKTMSKYADASGTKQYARLNDLRNTIQDSIGAIHFGNLDSSGLKGYADQLDRIGAQRMGTERFFKEAGAGASTLNEKLLNFKVHLANVASFAATIRMATMVIRPFVQAVTEIDTALTQLKIVTNDSGLAIESYARNILSVADRTAGSIKDLIDSTTTYSRLGYNLKDSTQFAELTAMLQNVGDIDATSATNAITAIVKAYRVNANDLEEVLDKLVETGNNFPISVSQIAEGMNNAGSMLSVATGGDVDKSIALLTAANTTVQNISKSSTGLRTIVARLRNVKAELNELGEEMTTAKYDEIVRMLTDNGVSITDQNGQLRDTYTVLKELSVAYREMGESERAALATQIAGTRQQNILNSLLLNFDEAERSMAAMADSEGALAKANEIYLDSIQAHVQQLKNAFASMSQSALSADLIKQFVDFGKVLIQVTTAVMKLVGYIGGIKTLIPMIITLLSIFKGEIIARRIDNILKSFRNFGTVLSTIMSNGIRSVGSFTNALSALGTQAETTGAQMNMALGVIGLIITAITILISIISKIASKHTQQIKDIAERGEEAGKSISELSSVYEEYNNVLSSSSSSAEDAAEAQRRLQEQLGLTNIELNRAAKEAGSYKAALDELVIGDLEDKLATQAIGVSAQKKLLEGRFGYYNWIGQVFDNEEYVPYDVSVIGRVTGATADQLTDMDYVATHLEEIGERIRKFGADVGYTNNEYIGLSSWFKDMKNILSDYSAELISMQNNVAKLAYYSDMSGAIDSIKSMRSELDALGADESQTVFGNIDTNNRQILEWTAENLSKYKEALASWGADVRDLAGSISTVFGSSSEYDGIEIAFSPIMQTDNGPVLLSRDTVDKYIFSLIEEAGEGWKADDLFKLDLTGLEVDGQKIHGLLADIGDTAIETGEAMHFVGKDGAIAQEFRDYRDALIEVVKENKNFIGSEEDAARAVDEVLISIDGLEDFYTVSEKAALGATNLQKGLQGLKEVSEGTANAISELDEALKADDYGTGMEKRADYYKKLLEEVENENWGGKHYKALAEYFNVDTMASIEDQLARIQELSQYYSVDADTGLVAFLNKVAEKGQELEGIALFDPNTGFFKWDTSQLKEFADVMGISVDMLKDFLGLYIQHTPPADYLALPPDQLGDWLEQDEIIKETADGLVLNKKAFDEFASSAEMDTDEVLANLQTLDRYSKENMIVLDFEIDPNQALPDTILSIKEYIASLSEAGYESSQIAAAIASSLEGLDKDYIVDIITNLPPELGSYKQQIFDALPEEVKTEITADTTTAEDNIARATELAQALADGLVSIDDLDVHPSVTIDGISTALYQTSTLLTNLNTLSSYGGMKPQKNAIGTKHARKGLSLLGDEYSMSGTPKPELVVSNGRAYLAGVNGPVLGMLNAGDVVYTYAQTKQILGNNLDAVNGIPAFSQGTSSRWWNKMSGGSGSLSSSSTYGNYYGTSSGSGSSASSSGSGDNWFEQQYELHNHYRKLDQETDEAYLTWLVAAWKKAYAEGVIELKDAHKYEEEAYELMKKIASNRFKEEYDTHQHMVAMGKETDQEYYSWLEWRHQVAYANNEITLEEYWKYQEEVYKKAKELINDYFNDIDHKIDMLENAGKPDQEIIAWDEEGMKYAEERIAELIKEGKDNNDSAVQEQQKKWWSYYKDRQKREDDTTKKAKSAADELIDYRKKMLKKDLDNEKSSLNQRLTTLRDFYSKQKELLRDTYDEDKYLDEQAKKRKAVSDLEIQLAQIEYDNSAWAQKKRLELLQELADAQKDLADFEKEHALQVAQDKLDELQEMQEKELDDQIEAIEKVTESEEELYKRALQDVQNGGQDLYEAMVAYNNQYGTGNSEDIAEMWDDAYTALKKYKDLFDAYYKDIKLSYGNDTTPGVVDTSKIDAGLNPVVPVLESQKPAATTSTAQVAQPQQTKKQTTAKADPVVGTAVVLKSNGKLAGSSYDNPSLTPASWVVGKTLYVQAAYPGRAAPYHIGTSTNFNDSSSWVGWVNKNQLVGYATGTRSALAGLHEINERGDEALFKTADGSTYRLFSGGERVFNSGATDFLYSFSNNPAAVLSAILSQIGGGMGEIKNNTLSQNISMGDIYIQGSATEKTISEIRREKRAEMDYMLKELNRLNRQ